MSTIEDKILDGPRIHYCDDGDDDVRINDDLDSTGTNSESSGRNNASSLFMRPDEEQERLERLSRVRWQGSSTNTGPKGVIEDYKRRLTSPRSSSGGDIDNLDMEFQELLNDDSILQELQTGEQLLDAIDKEKPNVLVLVHIYARYNRSCIRLNECLERLAGELKHIKFVTLDASVTNLSANFKENGVPALLAYKRGDLIKSLVQLEEFLDRDFDSSQLKELLRDNNMLV